MRVAALLALLLVASTASAEGAGRLLLNARSAPTDVVEDPWIDCAELADPAFTPVAVTSSSDLHTVAMNNCGSGCILELAPGTYADTNVIFGDTALTTTYSKTASVTPSAEVLIRAADPSNPPLLRAKVGVNAAVIHAKDVTARIRVEDVILDGRRSEQTAAAVTACTDTTPADGVCDGSSQTSTFATGFNTRNTGSGTTRSCLLRVQVRNTVSTGIQLSQAYLSTVQDSTVSGAGCTPALCPALSVPLDATTNALLKTAQGVQLLGGSDSAVVDSRISDVTKIGLECFTNTRRCHLRRNTIERAGIAGIVFNEADGDAMANTIRETGQWFSHNSTGNNVGQGIQWTNGNTYAASRFETTISGNTVSNSFGSGIQVGLAGTTYNDARLIVSNNTVSGSCNGSTRADSAGIELGDSTYDIAKITAENNSDTGGACIDGIRARNLRTHRSFRNGTDSGLEIDDVDDLKAISLDVTGNIDVDADTKGVIDTCTLGGMAIGADSIRRRGCGETPPETISTDWDTMVWDVDEWG